MKGGSRKFIVVRRPRLDEPNAPEKIIVVIGSPLNPKFYYHSKLLEFTYGRFGTHYKIHGGGTVRFSRDGSSAEWTATFCETSGDFGVFDPSVLGKREDIIHALGMKVRFSWEG
jgi:hypothetical protein